jgi:small subunit ribosomal protein S1
VEGYIRAADLSRERVDDIHSVVTVGQDVEAKFTGVNRKNHTIMLSIKAKDEHEEAEAVREYSRSASESGGATTLGDLIKEQLDNK